jgi:hypothetical protein
MIVVSNSGPLITLARVEHFALLRELLGHVYVPQGVYDEVVVAGAGLPGSRELEEAIGGWMEIRPVREPLIARSMFALGRGEAEAITLTLEIKADVVLLDDRKARRAAQFLGVPLMGTVGVLRLALEAGKLEDWDGIIKKLEVHGFRISTRILS